MKNKISSKTAPMPPKGDGSARMDEGYSKAHKPTMPKPGKSTSKMK